MSETTSELLMFQVGPHIYAARVNEVCRIRLLGQQDTVGLVTQSVLGESIQRRRGLVVNCGEEGERTLVVDQVLGVRAVAAADVRPLPAFAVGCLRSTAISGFALFDEAPTFLIDLPTLIREHHGGDAGSRVPERSDDG